MICPGPLPGLEVTMTSDFASFRADSLACLLSAIYIPARTEGQTCRAMRKGPEPPIKTQPRATR